MIALRKQWFDALPGDLQATVLTTAEEIEREVTPSELDFLGQQRKTWVHKDGELIALSPAEKADPIGRTGTIGDDIVKTKPELNHREAQPLRAGARRSP